MSKGTNTCGMGSEKSAAQEVVEDQVREAKGERRWVICRSLQPDRLDDPHQSTRGPVRQYQELPAAMTVMGASPIPLELLTPAFHTDTRCLSKISQHTKILAGTNGRRPFSLKWWGDSSVGLII
ncbi:hypothetical protein P691DRAFT_832203 [Macrolepiota fuliginosa MF-IS2]|uniref:Uncharacterized protein n=1 Tax=Macrolepiota fuliginosa MF-IS2 TaxID=1400762 RepID=A0A9P5X913_9AGAR|nr:hypothetical protein P691DRAFT_832203 [Macrolepiota fuliginosa MF-IS2]